VKTLFRVGMAGGATIERYMVRFPDGHLEMEVGREGGREGGRE